MIGRTELSEAARYADAQTEELGSLEAYCHHKGIEVGGLVYLAEQRALRMAMIMDGQDPTARPQDEFSAVRLSPHIQALLPHLMSTWIDGVAIGISAQERAT